MSFKGRGKITLTINAHVHIEILANIFIPLIENWFGDKVIFQDDNASCHRAKRIKVFLQERHIKINDMPNK